MKRLIALAAVAATAVCCFTACGDKKIDGTETVTLEDGHTIAVVTEEGGDVSRNERGDILIVETDENGKAVKDEDGNEVTKVAELNTAFVYGNRIEFKDYYLVIPDGWENEMSYADLIIKKTGTEEIIKVSLIENGKLDEKLSNTKTMLNTIKTNFPDAVITDEGIKIGEETCPYCSVFVPQGKNGKSQYIGYAFKEAPEGIYVFMITAEKDLGKDLGEVTEILGSVQYK